MYIGIHLDHGVNHGVMVSTMGSTPWGQKYIYLDHGVMVSTMGSTMGSWSRPWGHGVMVEVTMYIGIHIL